MQHDSNLVADNENPNSLKLNRLVLRSVEQTSSDEIVEMTSSDGSVFFIRTNYLQITNIEDIKNRVTSSSFPGASFSAEETDDIMQAGFAFSAERKANEYLERCEQSRFGLTQKLLKKGFGKKSIELALNRLESKNYLNDLRFSTIWLRNHCLTKYQGKIRLLSELLSRGISKSIASEAIENFFSDSEENEESMCEKAYQKGIRQRKSGDKLLKFLLDSGFSYKLSTLMIKKHNSND